jgi:competence protein ComEC
MSIKDPKNFFIIVFIFTIFGILSVSFLKNIKVYILLCFFILFLFYLVYSVLNYKNKFLAVLTVFISIILGSFLYLSSQKKFLTDFVKGERVGFIISNPKVTEFGQSFIFKTNKNEKVLVNIYSKQSLEYKNILKLDLKCKRPENFETDLNTIFDYKRYLKKDNIYNICSSNKVTIVSKKPVFQTFLYRFSDGLSKKIRDIFLVPHSEFVAGVLLGDRANIPKDIRKDFTKTGTIHVVALSGFNIAIVALFFERLFYLFFRKRGALILSSLSIILFVAMTGFLSSAIRAGIMALIVILAKFSYQKYSPIMALFFASFIMIILKPNYLLYDSSFHLSFLATLGIILLSPVFDTYFKFLKYKTAISTISTTLGAYTMTLPYVMYFFSGVSFIGILANIIVVPLIPILMLFGFIALILGYVSFDISYIFVFITETISKFILKIINIFSSFSFSYSNVDVGLIFVFTAYFLIFYFIFKNKKLVDL